MAEYGLHKNSEGYADPTAAEAIKGRAKPGEIYEYKGREVLIVKNQGGYSNILSLSDHIRNSKNEKESIEVAGRYTEPGMLSYAFNSNLGAFVERVSDIEFKCILSEIEASFNLCFYSNVQPEKETYELKVAMDRLNLAEAENKSLKKKLSLIRGMYDELLNRFIDRFGGYEDHA